MKRSSASLRAADAGRDGRGGSVLRVRFIPDPKGDGRFDIDGRAAVLIPPPDWEAALVLLKKLNLLQAGDGRRVSGVITEAGFEPWWYSQDRLFRFYLVPLTQLLPLLDLLPGAGEVNYEDLSTEQERVLKALSSSPDFPFRFSTADRSSRKPLWAGIAQAALFLISLAGLWWFRLTRRDTVFYIVDNVSPGIREDFRFSPLYRALAERSIRFAEYAHTLSPRQAFGNFLRRRRPVFFLEAADWWARAARIRIPTPNPEDSQPPAAPATAADRALWALVPTVLGWCAESAARQRVLVRALGIQRARRAIVFDDNRHNHELIAACRARGIPVLGFQHGVFNRFHAGLMAYGFQGTRSHAFHRYGVWSELFRERLLRASLLYRSDEVFSAGPVRGPDQEIPHRTPGSSGRIRVLVVSEPLARKQEVIPYLRALLADPSIELCLKLRPGEGDRSLAEYGLPADRVRLLRTRTVFEALADIDVTVGTYSTVLYEAALALVPAVWLRTSRAYGRELAEEGLAEPANEPADLLEVVRRAAALPLEERERRRDRIWGEARIDGARRLVDELEKLTAAPPAE
jgi:hypothetical protein